MKLIPKTYSIREITCHLDHKEKETLILIHSISSCGSVSGLFGFRKVKELKKAITFDEQGQLATSLSVKESKEKIIEAGLCFLQYIYGEKIFFWFEISRI